MENIARILNTLLSPVTLFAGMTFLYYAIDSLNRVKRKKNLPIAYGLIGIGFLITVFGFLSVIIYTLNITQFNITGTEVSGWRSLVSNIIMIAISYIMIKVFQNKI